MTQLEQSATFFQILPNLNKNQFSFHLFSIFFSHPKSSPSEPRPAKLGLLVDNWEPMPLPPPELRRDAFDSVTIVSHTVFSNYQLKR